MDYSRAARTYAKQKSSECEAHSQIPKELYDHYGVKKGLRDRNGRGVLTGLTNISRIKAFDTKDGELIPCDGELLYRGYDIKDLIKGSEGSGYVFEEGAYLLLFGELPNAEQLRSFMEVLAQSRELPTNFTRDVIMKAPSADIMNTMTRSVLTLASYDDRATDLSVDNVLRQCIQLISTFPMLAIYGYHAYNHYEKNQSMYIHRPNPELSAAENILSMLRPDMQFSKLEARVLDIALFLHMEHGGGNNSTFTTHVVTSSGTDTYSTIAAALGSLKGPKHGGANIKVVNMFEHIKSHVKDFDDEEEIAAYLERILNKEAFDHSGLIYGMGHAIYSISDPRARVFKGYVERLSNEKGKQREFRLYNNVEKIAARLISQKRKIHKGVSANVDFYSGFVYTMLGIPEELFTPIFAIARMPGWSAHRLEELINANKIIRPAYKYVGHHTDFVAFDER